MRPIEIERRSNRDNAIRIDLMMGQIIMAFDVVEVDRFGDARLLVKVAQIPVETGVINHAAQVALKMPMINRIEPDQGAEEPPIRFHHPIPEKITLPRQTPLDLVQRAE